jgi:NMD protein affecting ribosome stability and mRNA decay
MTFTNYNMKCVHCGQPVEHEEQVYCEDCEYEYYEPELEEDQDE